jgi:murein DD-endopeptidase MepM/ murein hydrolase activator NlpD
MIIAVKMRKLRITCSIFAFTMSVLTVASQEKDKNSTEKDFEQYKKEREQDFQDFRQKQETELKKMAEDYQNYYNEMMGLKKFYTEKKDTAGVRVVDDIISYENNITEALGGKLKVTEDVKFEPKKNDKPEKVVKDNNDKGKDQLEDKEIKPDETKDQGNKTLAPVLTPLPKAKARVTSPFGMRIHPIFGIPMKHNGIDFGPGYGAEIYAADNGKVLMSDYNGSYGNYILVQHNGQQSSAYAHLSKLAVRKGDVVKKGQIIGYVGSTGRATGPHLHYEVRTKGIPVDPGNYLLEYK